ncbi:uncharacterized protein LOC119084771 [Bradysia coprophila]|uniref:uncharacterized protein LOC119084771 n=1 Tax=Bradysia coprophila TaxID=38358 RepID=UPI00187D7C3D|nr:uncharacterized protein LOC119084771 [Bradysia coprophila]
MKINLPAELASWANASKTKADSFTRLLKILQRHGYPDLPSDSRTLLETPRQTSLLVRNVPPGQYIHIGIEAGALYTLRQNGIDVNGLQFMIIDYNTDGVQISKSTTQVFWPIWCRIRNPYIGQPFLCGIFYSNSGGPKDANLFILDFVNELKYLITNGLKVNNKTKIPIRAGRFMGDAPGRCDIMGLKGPTGYYGCSRCTTKGLHCENRVCFPELNAALRSDKDFKDRAQPQHHHFTSFLEEVLELLGVTQAPIDGMHLVYACVTRRILFWLNTDCVNYKFRLSSAQIGTVNNLLEIAALTRPVEFARPVKGIHKYKKFKCTQLRQFLLYLSIVVLKKVFSEFQYEHLLLLVIGIRLLSDEKQFVKNNALAKKMLHDYVQILETKFGKWRVIYSVHNLIHLADEVVTQNEPLDRFSMWEFETANNGLKEFTKRQGALLLIFQCNEDDLADLFEIDSDHIQSKMFMIKDGGSSVFIPLL